VYKSMNLYPRSSCAALASEKKERLHPVRNDEYYTYNS